MTRWPTSAPPPSRCSTSSRTVRALTETAAAAARRSRRRSRLAGAASRAARRRRSADEWVAAARRPATAQGRLITLKECGTSTWPRIDALRGEADRVRAGHLRPAGRSRSSAARTRSPTTTQKIERDRGRGAHDRGRGQAAARTAREQAAGLELLTEVVSSLDIADTTTRTTILESIGEVLGGVNRARATVDGRRRELAPAEGRAEFAAEFALLGQAITGALAVATPRERCDDQLGRLLLQLENLESRFAEFDDFLAELGAKRDGRLRGVLGPQADAARRAGAARGPAGALGRTRSSPAIAAGSRTLASLDEINTYFAADPMVAKLRVGRG